MEENDGSMVISVLVRWTEYEGCVDPHLPDNMVMINMVGLPVHLWRIDLFRKVGISGGFVNVKYSSHDMSRVRIMVKNGGRVLVSLEVVDGDLGYRIWLLLEL